MNNPLSDIIYHARWSHFPDWIVIRSVLSGRKADGNGDDRLHWTVTGSKGEILEVNVRPENALELLNSLAAELGYEVFKRPGG